MSPWRVLLLVVATACGGENVEMSVDLRTDYVPGVEFTTVRVELLGEGRSDEARASAGDYVSGQRVAELGALPPRTRRRLAVELVDARGAVLARREVLVRHETDLVVTVVLTRDCRDVSCPRDPGGSATSCLGGECVDPTCIEGDEETCSPGCSVDADCAAMAACARPVCSSGVCLYGSADSCAADEYCDASAGCVPVEPSVCTPPLDVTYDLLTGSREGEGLTALPEYPALVFDGDEAWLSFVTTASPDLPDIGSVYVASMDCDGTFGAPQMLILDATRPSIAFADGRLVIGSQPMGVYAGSDSIRFVDPDTGLPLGPPLDPELIGTVYDVVARGTLFDVFAPLRIGDGDVRVRVVTIDGEGAVVGEPVTPVPEAGVAEQERPNGAPAAGGSAVALLSTLPDDTPGLAGRVIVQAPFTAPVALETSSLRTGRTPGLVIVGDVAWVSVQEGPNSPTPDDQRATLHSVSASGPTRHELPAPPAGAGDYLSALVEGPQGGMLHIWTRRFAADPPELLIRRIDVDGETPTVGPEIVIPTDDPVAAATAVHVGAGSYLMVWTEAAPDRSATLRARFVQP